MVNKHFLYHLLILPFTMKMAFIGVAMSLFAGESLFAPLHAQVDFFPPPAKPGRSEGKEYAFPKKGVEEKARVIFFIAPGCRSCPDEAVKLERELKRLGVTYEMEGVFLGDPAQVGVYLSALRGYPFNFELGVDMDGGITRDYGVQTFPSAVIEMGGKRTVIKRSDELEEKMK